MGHVFLVQDPEERVLAVFTEEAGARGYAAARAGRTVTTAPIVQGTVVMTTVHTRWVEVDVQGVIRAHEHETYGWCPELDGPEGPPPVAEVEHYLEGTSHRLLGVGTDLTSLDEQLRQSLAEPVPPGHSRMPTPARR